MVKKNTAQTEQNNFDSFWLSKFIFDFFLHVYR